MGDTRRAGPTTGRGLTKERVRDSESAGLVGPCFSAFAGGLAAVEWITLRDERPIARQLCFAPNPSPRETEKTPVDDLRRVRRRLSEETGNDVNRLADHAREVAEELREKLGLQPATP